MFINKMQNKYSIAKRLTVSIFFTVTLASLMSLAFVYYYEAKDIKKNFEDKSDEMCNYLIGALQIPLWDYNEQIIKGIGETLSQNDAVSLLIIKDRSDKTVYSNKNESEIGSFKKTKTIKFKGEAIGEFQLSLSNQTFLKKQYEYIKFIILVTSVILITLLIVTGLFIKVFLRTPLQRLNEIVEEYASDNYDSWDTSIPYTEFKAFEIVLKKMGKRIYGQIQSLRTSEEKFRSYIDGSPDGVFVADENGRYLEVNRSACIMSGYTDSELLNMSIPDLVPHDSIKQVTEHFQRLKDTGYSSGDLEFIQKNGSRRWWSIDAVRLSNNIFLGFAKDITDRKYAEESLLQREYEFHEIFDATNEAILVVENSLIGRIIDCNERSITMFGYDCKEQLLQKSIGDLGSGIDPYNEEILKELFHTSKEISQIFEWLVQNKNGDTFFVEVSLKKTKIGGYDRILAVIRDINDRKKYDELQEFLALTSRGPGEEQFFENLARYLSRILKMEYVCIDRLEGDGLTARTLAVWSDDHFEDNVTYALKDTPCGDAVGQVVCCFPSGVANLFHKDQVLKDLKAESYAGVTLWGHSGKPIGLIAVIGRSQIDNRYLVEGILKMVAVRAAGELERIDAEVALIESEKKYRQVVNSMHETLSVIDRDGVFIFVNEKAAQKLCGGSVDEVVGKNILDFVPFEQANKLIESYRSVLLSGSPLQRELMVTLADGDKWFLNTLKPIQFLHGNQSSILSMSTDITERKKVEIEKNELEEQLRQAHKMESVGRLAGGVAHDFNNMLGVILGHADMILEQLDPTLQIYDDLTEIRNAAQRSADLTRQLLAFARKQAISPRILDLNDVMSGMIKMLRRLIGEDIELAWLPGANLWPVNADPSQIDQIMANLCVNAREAITKKGRITVETMNHIFDSEYCSFNHGFTPGQYVMLSVSDDGNGMDKKTLDNIFEPFFTTKGVGEGTGLGLATVYGIVKQNNGFINVYSELSKGTSFKIYLPRHLDNIEQTQHLVLHDAEMRGSETILLVEDEPSILKMTTMMLERLGYTVLIASTPSEGIRVATDYPDYINLLITDVVMPEMNGRELSEIIQSIYPGLKCLFMSGYTANIIEHHGVLEQDFEFIQKPFSKKNISAKVRSVLDSSLLH